MIVILSGKTSAGLGQGPVCGSQQKSCVLSHPLPSEVPFLNTNVAKCLPPGFDHRVSQLHSVNTYVLRVADRMADQYSSGAKAKCEGDLRN